MAKSNGECELCGEESSLRSFGDKNLCMKCEVVCVMEKNHQKAVGDVEKWNELLAERNRLADEKEFFEKKAMEAISDRDEIAGKLADISTEYSKQSEENHSLRAKVEKMAGECELRGIPQDPQKTEPSSSRDSIILDIIMASLNEEGLLLNVEELRRIRKD